MKAFKQCEQQVPIFERRLDAKIMREKYENIACDFTLFYKELDALLEEFGKAAEERRHSQTAHLPIAVSVNQLIEKVLILIVRIIIFMFKVSCLH